MAGKGSKIHGSVANSISTLQQECSSAEYTAALRTILRILKNVQQHPGEGSYKQIKKTNKAFSEKVWMLSGGQQIMYCIGWIDLDDTIVLLDSHKVAAAIILVEASLRTNPPGRATGSSVTKSARSAKSAQTSQSGWANMAAGYSKGWTGDSNPQSGGSNAWSGGSNGWSGGGGGYGGCVCGQCGYGDDDDSDDSDDDDSYECRCGQCGTNAAGWRCVCGQCGENDCGSWTSTYQTQKTKTTVTRKPARRARTTGSSYGGGRSYGGGSYNNGGYGGGSYGSGGYGGGSYGGGASCGTGGG